MGPSIPIMLTVRYLMDILLAIALLLPHWLDFGSVGQEEGIHGLPSEQNVAIEVPDLSAVGSARLGDRSLAK